MADKQRINLAFNLNLPLQRQTWEIIKKIPPGRRTEQICRLLCNNRDAQQESLLSSIRQIVREELQNVQITAAGDKENTREEQEPQEVSDDVLGFLRALQEGDGFS